MLRRSLLIASSILALTACDPNVETRGHVVNTDWQDSINPGSSDRDDVLLALGYPSTRSSFGQETWYYITTKRESFAFFEPEIADQEVLAVTFDANGYVEQVDQLGREDLQEIEYSSRETPTSGHSLTFMEQLLGNLGRFNNPTGLGPGGGRGGGRPPGR